MCTLQHPKVGEWEQTGGGMNGEELRWWHKWSPELAAGFGRGEKSGCLWHSLHLGGAERYSEHFFKSGQYSLLWTQVPGQWQSTEVWLQLLGSCHLQIKKKIKPHSLVRTKPQRPLPALPAPTHHGCICRQHLVAGDSTWIGFHRPGISLPTTFPCRAGAQRLRQLGHLRGAHFLRKHRASSITPQRYEKAEWCKRK